ncbi:alkaline phosphatase family protein [Halalkalicoccus sp. NIPERK01]|uniref:alkaline phosphatase family protein n=1 Tax=Halalkalicoccus sp. NIPERK01 TaxID=3053469 RepID=UPI00256F0F67|nr:alkaline phosphatase family protein [Halalkalicoccus sp. NIPERK01]MDL5362734.1 alkaline phosphatase family protein [Halalkalicoccus sp. NIPERK01]
MNGRMDTLLIGIDAACQPVFDRLSETDSIPHLESLIDRGVSAPLESQIPPWTPSAWPSMYTGVNPGKHGVYGFVDFEGYDWGVVTANHVREHALWKLLDEHDRSSVIVNVPVTHPPDEIDGAIVPGFIGPENPGTHPKGILEEVREAIGEYRVYPNYSRGDDRYTDAEKMEEYCTLARMRGEAFRYLAGEYEPDFGFVQFQKTDTVFHEFEGDPAKVRQIYEATDEQIGRILEECDPKRVFVASDHGMGPYENYEFRVNEFLRREGYVEATSGGKGMPSWNPIRDQLQEGQNETSWEPGKVERLAAAAAKVGITPSRAAGALDRIGLGSLARRYAPSGVTRTGSQQVDFPASRAYMRARTELGVRINLEGRDPEGVVPPKEYEEVREDLIERLQAIETPDGDPVFGEVVPREEYFWGPYTEKAVDVLTVPNDFEQFLSAQLREELFGPPTEPWNHKLDGLFVAAGQGIDSGVDLTDAHLFDVAPTVCAALGVPYSDRMDGRVLPVVEDVGSTAYPEYTGSAAVSTEDERVEERLSDLGYLE